MTARTADWTGVRPAADPARPEGLRERKKRQMRQQLTDTATEMFLDRGFDAVRITEIADACGVSEKTVFNYFPTKESLVVDLPDATMASLRAGLADPGRRPIEATLLILADELAGMTSWLESQPDQAEAIAKIRRYGLLIETTPSLRAYRRDMTDQVIAVAAGMLAERAGVSADDPEPQIAAIALIGLWRVQFAGLRKFLDGTRTPAQVGEAVTADVRRAARLIETGLSAFAPAPRAGA